MYTLGNILIFQCGLYISQGIKRNTYLEENNFTEESLQLRIKLQALEKVNLVWDLD